MPDFRSLKELLVREIDAFFATLRDKGLKRFMRAFVAAGFVVFGSYELLYRPPQSKSDRLEGEIAHAKTMHDYGEKYGLLRDALTAAYARLPSDADREQWLTNSVRALLDMDQLESDDFRPMRENEKNGLIQQDSTLTLHVRFKQFYALMLHIEGAKPMLHLASADLVKANNISDPSSLGMATVHVDVSTIIPKKRLDQ
jgi:hypothetical protein